ncbi:MAG: glycosyltransferase [Pseudomonadota bacterium]
MTPTFSLAMIVRDEEPNLPRSLGPVRRSFDEVIVVDSGSTDGTVDLAFSYGAKVFHLDWTDDFSAARNFSIQAASGDWIMWLDADNHVSPRDVDLLRGLLDGGKESIIWCTEKVIPQGESLIQKRVFPKRPDVFFSGRVHEQLVHPDGLRSVVAPVEIMHWGYADQALAREKGLRNLRLLEKMAQAQPDDMYSRYQLGRTLFNLRRFDEALAWLESDRPDADLAPHARLLRARVLERLGKMDQARDALVLLTARVPDYSPGFHALGNLLYAQGDFEDAARNFEKFISLDSGDLLAGTNRTQLEFSGRLLLGRCLEKLNRPNEARRAYLASRKIDPGNPEPLLALARLAAGQGNKDEALEFITACLAAHPANRGALRLRLELEAT